MSRGLLSLKSLAIIGATLIVVAAVVGASIWDDHRTDRRRPMFLSVLRMEQLQYDVLKQGQKPVLGTVRPHESLQVGKKLFRPARHVTVAVRQRDGQTCIQGRNQYHDRTQWICVDTGAGRPKLGALQ